MAFQLDDNAVSGMIAAGNGYYFIKCLNKYNEELTEANKSNIVEKREKEAFDDVYNEFVASLSSRLNTDLWDGIKYRKFFDNRAVKKTLTIPAWLNTMAERQGVNFSMILQNALKAELHI